ncbi:MAG TPA: M56 family metallopeptidase, partial [Longimicrobium sp.]|uniref:M56 family metallopeptidase n=1 Tax=Longimicrobium sp. TaxID=2029185 RepID=UPI002ED78C09
RAAAALAAGGVLIGMLWLAVGFWGAARLGRRAELVRDPEWLRASQDAAERLGLRRPVLLLRSRAADMPATWGLLWPSVIVPSMADGWPEDRRRAVLAHELAHVKRFDCLTQALAQAACVLFWWHPAVWYAARQLRIERERACDDLVLRGGARASDYAAHLLEVARSHKAMRLAAPAMVSMARPSHLESRLLWVLDGARARGVPSSAATAATILAGLLLVAPLSAMRPTAARTPAAPPVERQAALPAPVQTEKPAPSSKEKDAETAKVHPAALKLPAAFAAQAPAPAPIQVDTPPARDRDRDREVRQLTEMRAVGVTPEYVAEMRAAGFGDLDGRTLTSLRAQGVTRAYVDELRRLGLTDLSARRVAGMKAVGVSPAYVEEMRRAGLGGLSAQQLTGLRALGVTRAYVDELRRMGFQNLSARDVTGMRAVGVTAAFAEEMRRAGLGQLSADDLAGLRAQGVTGEYIRELTRHGIVPRSADEVQGLRAVGVTGEYVEQMRAENLAESVSVREITSLRAQGVTPAYAREMESVRLTGLSMRQLSALRAHGVTADYVRRVRAAGFDAATVDEVVRLRAARVEPRQ